MGKLFYDNNIFGCFAGLFIVLYPNFLYEVKTEGNSFDEDCDGKGRSPVTCSVVSKVGKWNPLHPRVPHFYFYIFMYILRNKSREYEFLKLILLKGQDSLGMEVSTFTSVDTPVTNKFHEDDLHRSYNGFVNLVSGH